MKIKLQRQTTNNECGLCCIAMLLDHYGFSKPVSYYRNKFNVGRDGVSIKGLYHILEQSGLEVQVFKVSDIDLFPFDNKNPYIAHLNNNHFVIISKSRKSNTLIINDPARGQYKTTLEEFKKKFGDILVFGNVGPTFVKNKESINQYKYLWETISVVKYTVIFAFIITIFVELLSLVYATVFRDVINEIAYLKNVDYLMIFLKVLSIISSIFVISIMRNKVFLKLQIKLMKELNLKMYSHLLNLRYSFYDNRNTGNIVYRLGLLNRLREYISTNVLQMMSFISNIIVLTLFLSLNYQHLFQIILIIILLYGITIRYAGNKLLSLQENELSSNESLSNLQIETVTSMFHIKCMNLEDNFYNRYKNLFEENKNNYSKSQKTNFNVTLVISIISMVIPIGVILFLSLTNNFGNKIGDVILLYSLLQNLISNISNLFNDLISTKVLKGSLFYLNDLIEERKHLKSGNVLLDDFEELKIEGGYFKYSDNSEYVLKNVNLSIEKGEKVGLVGLSGSGKTTIVKLMGRLYDLNGGKITINNHNIKDIDCEVLENFISIVPQSMAIFSDTIKENLILSNRKVSDFEVKQALITSSIYDEINEMPMGIYTHINGEGMNLSGGQLQRLSIARALLSKPKLLIMDESTSSLDSVNETNIYENLKKRDISTLVITHRLATVKDADKIYLISGSEIVASGSHDYLVNNNEMYKDMYIEQQNEGVNIYGA